MLLNHCLKFCFFSLMCNVSFINNVFQFLAESVTFVISWIELISYVYASYTTQVFYIFVVRTIRVVVENWTAVVGLVFLIVHINFVQFYQYTLSYILGNKINKQHMISWAYLSYLLCWCKNKVFVLTALLMNFTFLVKQRVILRLSDNNNWSPCVSR